MNQNLYRDIALRCDGDIYIGVVGPVRTGKSTFIKRFMELLVLPNMEGEHRRERAIDELPVSGAGRTIMTTQPKFVPNEAAEITLRDQASIKVRLVDCVGYLIRGVLGLNEGEDARMVRTPWFDHDIPFEEAAELGTRKVIAEHSTLGVVVTTDGSITEMPRAAYAEAEERVVRELNALGKPFVVVINTSVPNSDETLRLRNALSEKYGVTVTAMDVEHMTIDDLNNLLESLLFEFPLTEIDVVAPRWVDALKPTHWLVAQITDAVRAAAQQMTRVRDHTILANNLMALDDAERATQRTIRRYMDTNPNMGDQPARYATHITVLYELCDGIALARTPLRILMVFSGVIQTYPRHWREIDDAFRDAFTRYVNGTPLEDITPSIPMGEHTTLRLAGFAQSVNDYRMGD